MRPLEYIECHPDFINEVRQMLLDFTNFGKNIEIIGNPNIPKIDKGYRIVRKEKTNSR